eukprot:GFUD01027150.1.p1 GENE.GFUD01027150.1~~GFUD01027150.1.p1  ORF type:complete len:312 (+),score=72.84 GFUD01027150.1:87-1022(+)
MLLPVSPILLLVGLMPLGRGFVLEVTDPSSTRPNLLQLAISLNLTTCVDQLKEAGIDKILNHEGPFTVFCPINDAFDRQADYPGSAGMKEKMLQHVGTGMVTSDKFRNELTIRSLLPGRKIRVNVYTAGPFSTETINGQAVLESNHLARNGVIHILYSVMDSVYPMPGSVVGELQECCTGTTQLLAFVHLSGLYQVLDQTDPITLLAPTDAAWAKLSSAFLNHLDKNIPLLRQVLLAHVLQGTWYTVGLSRGDSLKTLAGVRVTVDKDRNGTVSYSGAVTSLADVVAGNGAVQVIDEVLLPKHVFDKPFKV